MKRLPLLLLGAGLLLACHKEDVVYVTTPAAPLLEVLRRHAPAFQVFGFALGQPQVLRTAAGATLSFPANAFRLPDGRTLATGTAELRVRELYAVPDMLLANLPTTTAHGVHLVSGGEFIIQAWQGTTRLRLVPTPVVGAAGLAGLTLNSPVPPAGLDTTRMRLWQLPPKAFADVFADSLGWSPVGMSTSPWLAAAAAGRYTVTIPLDSIGGWNIDQFWHAYQNNGTAAVGVDVPADATETRVYFRPVGYNGLARGTATAAPTRWTSTLPLGAAVVAVVVQVRNGQLYYGTLPLTTRASQVVQPPLEALSETEIVRRIRLL